MATKPFFIGPYEEGLNTANKSWMIPDSAFAELKNAYVWRGRVKKRVGSKLFESTTFTGNTAPLGSRLRIALGGGAGVGITNGAGNATGTVPGTVFKVGQLFSIGTAIYTVQATGTPVNMLRTDGTTTAQFNTTTGVYTFAGAPATTQIYWYPAEPVMGIVNYEQVAITDEPTYCFDTQFAYYRTGNAWDRLGAGIWTGSDSQFFWATNYRGVTNDNYYLFVVNNNRADRIQYWNGAAWTTITPQTRQNATAPALATNYVLHSARIILSFKDRLIALNTLETVDNGAGAAVNAQYAQRARWSINGNPIGAAAPACLGAWYDDVPGVGGWIDAPTRQAIISAKILKDRLIVYFERSTWELVYTNNQVLPFVWQTIDDELGVESTFSSVLMDRAVYGVGETGVHACDGLHVQRIDSKIPDYVFQIHNGNDGVERVAGIRDYSTEMIYWTVPHALHNPTYPDQLLVYNYKNDCWSLFDDSITAFGYYQNAGDVTWGSLSSTWGTTARLWASASYQSKYKNVIAGNQQGFTFIMDRGQARNAEALQISNVDITGWPVVVLTVDDHNLYAGDYILIEHSQGITTNFNDRIFKVLYVDSISQIQIVPYDAALIPTGTYTGGGTIARISLLDIKTKEYNFYPNARDFYINEVIFNVDRTENGKADIQFYCSSNEIELATEAIANGVAVGDYTLETYAYATEPFEADRTRLDRPVYIQAAGECIQLRIYMLEENRFDVDVQKSPFELNSMTFFAGGAEKIR